jgi:membrane-bound lytic murein transglycosylase D
MGRTSMIARIHRTFARRKIETVSIAVVAALAAMGFARNDGPGTAISAVTTAVSTGDVASAASFAATTPRTAAAKRRELPSIQHPRVDSWIRRFTTDMRGSYAIYLDRMPRYESMISKKLASRGMPQELIYLAMIESGFNPSARSPVKASGLWQFMGPTARQYGLRVTRRVDERNNPSRATDAALKYLGYLYDRFGSWYLAAAAYNTGEGRVGRVLQQVTGRKRGTDADFYRIAHRLPRETRDYVPKLIAAARIGKNPARYGFN